MASPELPKFSAPGFNTLLDEKRAQEETRQPQSEQTTEIDLANEQAERILWLMQVAAEVAKAAKEAKIEQKPIYKLREKSAARRFMGNRGPQEPIETTTGWVIVPPTSDVVTKLPGKANLANNSGLGLVLTKDGKLFGCVARKGLKPASERFTTIPRAKIGRNTFIPKSEFDVLGHTVKSIPEKTFLPRYRPETEGLPTLIIDPEDPDNGLASMYFTPLVIEQSYEALAQFVATKVEPALRSKTK